MTLDVLLQQARQITPTIHDEVLAVRALLHLAELEHACEAAPRDALDSAERCIRSLRDPVARVILACDLAQTCAKLRHDPYRLLEFARSETLGVSIRAEIYIALVEGKLGYHTERRLHWAEECARVQSPAAWLTHTQAAVVRIQADTGDWSAARCTIDRIEDPVQKLLSGCELAISAHQQTHSGALEAFPPIEKITRLSDLVRAKCILLMTAQAMGCDVTDHLQEFVEWSRRLHEPAEKQVAGLMILRILVRCRDWNAIGGVIRAVPDSLLRDAILVTCQEASALGHFEHTHSLASKLMVPGYRDYALYNLVRAAVVAGSELRSRTEGDCSMDSLHRSPAIRP